LTLEAIRRSPLEGRALPASARVRATPLPHASRWLLRGGPDVAGPLVEAFGVAPPLNPLASAESGARSALWLGPDEWLLIDDDASADLGAGLEAALAGVFHALVDVSHRQVAIDISGPGAERTLSAGAPLDMDLSAFPVGMVTRTLLVKAEVMLWRRGPERFRLEVARSVAAYVAAELTQSAEDQHATSPQS
jgi:sarcosine oxidase subunit gamma